MRSRLQQLFYRLSVTLLLGFTLLISQSSVALEGGSTAISANYPGLVILSYDTPNDTFTSWSNCTGIVLEPRRVLTTLDCVYGFSLGLGPSPLIPENQIFVHPIINGEIGGGFLPTVPPTLTPNTAVSSYVLHPQSQSGSFFGPYNLAILYLSADISISPSTLYGGKNKFTGDTATALGWREESRPGTPLNSNYFLLNKLSFPLVNGDTNINGLCFDDEPLTGTVFCGGLQNATNFLESHDQGAPLYRTVNGQNTVVGIASSVSFGTADNGVFQYEKYARLSEMTDFILAHAPNTQFWNEKGAGIAESVNLAPLINILLFDDEA